jgi:hypothetical protein
VISRLLVLPQQAWSHPFRLPETLRSVSFFWFFVICSRYNIQKKFKEKANIARIFQNELVLG